MASRGVDGVTIPSSQVPTQVGKTCGGTILGYLKKNGIAFHEVHLHKLDKETLARHKRVIISARDPVDRLVRAARTSNDGSRRARAAPSTHLHRRRSRRLTGAARKRAAIGHAQHSMLISSTVSSRCTSASTLVSRASSTRCTASTAYLGAGKADACVLHARPFVFPRRRRRRERPIAYWEGLFVVYWRGPLRSIATGKRPVDCTFRKLQPRHRGSGALAARR